MNYLKIGLILIFFPLNFSYSQNLDNLCNSFSDAEVQKIIQDLELKRYSVSEINNCQKKSRKLFIKLIKINSDYLQYADDEIKNDAVFIKDFVTSHPKILKHISFKLQSDPVFFKSVAKLYNKALAYASYDLINNRSFMKTMVDLNPNNFKYASSRLQNDLKFVIFSLNKDGSILRFIPEKLANNKEIVLTAIKSNILALSYIPQKLRNDPDILKIVNKSKYSFLFGMDPFLKENYSGSGIGPLGSRGYRIVNQAKFLDRNAIIDRKDFFRWKYVPIKDKIRKLNIAANKLEKISWKSDLIDYPKLTKAIEKILKKQLDQNSIDAMSLTSLWQISDNPEILVFKLYLLRKIDNSYNKFNQNNISYLVGIAASDHIKVELEEETKTLETQEENNIEENSQKNNQKNVTQDNTDKKESQDANIQTKEPKIEGNWTITVVDSNLDIDLENNIILKHNHIEYEFWDVYKSKNNDESNIIFKIDDKNSQYFKIFSKQQDSKYKPIFTGGGYVAF